MPNGPYFDWPPVFQVLVDDEPVPPEQIVVGDLTDWPPPAVELAYHAAVDGERRALPVTIAVDPVLGRITCPPGVEPRAVSYAYGFSADAGGGPYDRHDAVDRARGGREVTWQAGVGKRIGSVRGEPVFDTLGEALAAWNELGPGETGLIAIADSATYDEAEVGPILLPGGSTLLIVAGSWPVVEWDGHPARLLGQVVPELVRPVLRGDLSVRGVSRIGDARAGQLCVDGLTIDGAVRVRSGALGRLRLADTTLVPGRGGLVVEDANHGLRIELERAIVGGVRLATTVPELIAADSIFDGAVEAPGAAVDIRRATVLGSCHVGALEAIDSIFGEALAVEHRHRGGLDACYVPPGATTGRRARCQPDMALAGAATAAARDHVLARVVPSFASRAFGDPFYAQLASARVPEIACGASNESEMGAFNALLQPLRHAHLRAALDEHLGLDLEAGIYYVT